MSALIQIEPLQIIERLTVVAPLGVRFWDEVTGKYIGDGLIVTAYPPRNPRRRIQAFVNHSSTYILKNVPGLHDVESGKGDSEFWNKPPKKRTFIIEVIDSERRFQPFTFTTDLPTRGLFEWQGPPDESPPVGRRGVPLYSSPSRSVPQGMAALRAELREWRAGPAPIGDPAAWAVIEARLDGRVVARGFADDQGRITLLFPFPEPSTDGPDSPPAVSHLSPPGPAGPALRDQEWNIELAAAYGRLRPAPPTRDVPALPDLSDIFLQPPAMLYADSEQHPLTAQRLRFGQELIVRSKDSHGDPMSVVLITPAGSPP